MAAAVSVKSASSGVERGHLRAAGKAVLRRRALLQRVESGVRRGQERLPELRRHRAQEVARVGRVAAPDDTDFAHSGCARQPCGPLLPPRGIDRQIARRGRKISQRDAQMQAEAQNADMGRKGQVFMHLARVFQAGNYPDARGATGPPRTACTVPASPRTKYRSPARPESARSGRTG